MDVVDGGFGFKKIRESKIGAPRIPIVKAMNTITTRPLLNLKLLILAALALMLLLQSV